MLVHNVVPSFFLEDCMETTNGKTDDNDDMFPTHERK